MDENLDQLFMIFGYLKERNEYEYVHSANVALLTVIQAKSLNLSKDQISQIGIAAFLHDIGKLGMPLEILNNPGKLTDEQFEIMKQHPLIGAQLLIQYRNSIGELPALIAFQHHLKYDLSGYPKNATFSKDLNLGSLHTTISDVYDALRSNRSYRPSIPCEKVYEIMQKEKGS